MSTPHFRILLPEEYKGKKHTAAQARVFIQREGQEEIELTKEWPIVSWETVWSLDDVMRLTVHMIGTIEVQYGERGSTP